MHTHRNDRVNRIVILVLPALISRSRPSFSSHPSGARGDHISKSHSDLDLPLSAKAGRRLVPFPGLAAIVSVGSHSGFQPTLSAEAGQRIHPHPSGDRVIVSIGSQFILHLRLSAKTKLDFVPSPGRVCSKRISRSQGQGSYGPSACLLLFAQSALVHPVGALLLSDYSIAYSNLFVKHLSELFLVL